MTRPVTDPAFTKLQYLMGPETATRVWADTLQRIGLATLATPDDRVRFARALIEQGGLLSVIGHSIITHAILHGATNIAEILAPRRG